MKHILTDTACKNAKAKPDGKLNRLHDGDGLYLFVTPQSKTWHYRYKNPQTLVDTSMALVNGTYPAMSLEKARKERDRLAALRVDNVNPQADKADVRKEKLANRERGFREVSENWFVSEVEHATPPLAPRTLHKNRCLLNTLQGEIGDILVTEMTTSDVAAMAERVRRRISLSYAGSLIRFTSCVLNWCIISGIIKYNVTLPVSQQFTIKARRGDGGKKKRASVARTGTINQKIARVGELWRAIDGHKGIYGRAAAQFMMLTLVRPGEAADAEWSGIDLDEKVWVIPAAKLKMRKDHNVPLSKQAVAILRQMQPLTGKGRWVFSRTGGMLKLSKISIEIGLAGTTINKMLRKLGYDTKLEQTAHGFRTIASTLLNDELNDDELPRWPKDAVELQLAHIEGGSRGDYCEAAMWKVRVRMMQHWADRLTGMLGDSGNVVPLNNKRRAA